MRQLPGLTPRLRSGTLPIVRTLIGTVLLLLQLSPVFGAATCMRMAAQGARACSIPMHGAAQQPHSGAPEDCARLAVCAPAAPAVYQAAVQLVGALQDGYADYASPASLMPGETAPPVHPPPIL